MTETVLNNSTNAVFIPTIIAQKCLQRFGSYLNLAKTIARDSDYETATVGATIQVTKTGAVSANTKTAGNVYTKQAPTGTTTPVTLDTHKEVTFTIVEIRVLVYMLSHYMRRPIGSYSLIFPSGACSFNP